MIIIEPFEYAPDFVKNIAKAANINPSAIAVIRLYKGADEFSRLRDRTTEMSVAVSGMSGKDRSEVVTMSYTGKEMYDQFGFEAVGAQFAADFRIIFS